jgi:hypothetical protein
VVASQFTDVANVSGKDNPSSRRRFVFLIAAFSVLRNERPVVRCGNDKGFDAEQRNSPHFQKRQTSASAVIGPIVRQKRGQSRSQ